MKKLLATLLAAGIALSSMSAVADIDSKADRLKRVKQTMVMPPMLPEHTQVAKGDPRIIVVRLVVEEKQKVIDAQGTTLAAMTFNGSVPGPIIVVHQNDYVELTLVNPKTSTMSHNIDLHSVTGALGGAGLTEVAPGEEATIRFKASKAGVFVYHCAPGGIMIPYHVVSLSRCLRHERRHHGVASRWFERQQWKIPAL